MDAGRPVDDDEHSASDPTDDTPRTAAEPLLPREPLREWSEADALDVDFFDPEMVEEPMYGGPPLDEFLEDEFLDDVEDASPDEILYVYDMDPDADAPPAPNE